MVHPGRSPLACNQARIHKPLKSRRSPVGFASGRFSVKGFTRTTLASLILLLLSSPVTDAQPLRIAIGAVSVAHVPGIIALEGGYFAKQNLQPELIMIRGGPQTVAALVGGDVGFAQVFSVPIVSAKLGGARARPPFRPPTPPPPACERGAGRAWRATTLRSGPCRAGWASPSGRSPPPPPHRSSPSYRLRTADPSSPARGRPHRMSREAARRA